jgi:hypothetical protein
MIHMSQITVRIWLKLGKYRLLRTRRVLIVTAKKLEAENAEISALKTIG